MTDEGKTPETEEEAPRDYESEIKSLRNEAASYRVERNDLRKQVEALSKAQKDREDAEKSELQKAVDRAAEAERLLADKDREIAEAMVRSKVVAEASKMNVVDPDAVYRLLDLTLIDEDPKSVKKALEALLKEKPYLQSQQPPVAGPGGPPIKGKPTEDQAWLKMFKEAHQRGKVSL